MKKDFLSQRHCVGDGTLQGVEISNVAVGGSDNANVSFIGTTGGTINNSGTITGLTSGSSDNISMQVGINTAAAGNISGTTTVELITDGSVTGTLEVFGTADITVSGNVYRLADPSINNSPIDFGNVHVDDLIAAQAVSITNNALNDGFSETLNATADGTTGGVIASGSFFGLGPESTNNSDISVNIDTTSAGDKSGTAIIDFESNGDGINSLGQTALASQTVNVTGAVYRYASPGDHTPEPVVLTNVHVGDTSEQALTITNTAVADTFSEGLNATIGSATGNAMAGGSFNLLAAGVSDSSSLVVGIDTSTAGAKSGTAQIELVSDGAGTSDLGQTSIGSQTVNVSGNVYRYASASDHTPEPVVLTNVHVGDTSEQTLIITNTAVADTFSEGLNATIGNATGNTTAGGSFNLLAAGVSDSSSLVVGIDTSTAGTKSGTAQIDLVSDGIGTSELGQTAIGSQTVNVSGNVYRYASAGDHTPEPVVLTNVHVGDTSEQTLIITNTAVADTFSEGLNATIGSATGNTTAGGSFNLLAAGASDSSSLVVGIDTSTAGAKSGTAQIELVSDGAGTSDLGQTSIGSQTVNVSGNVYRLADVNTLNSVNFGSVHVGDSVGQALDITNTAVADGFSESLNASFAGVSDARILTSGSITQLAAGASDYSSMVIGLDTSAVGTITGIATVDFQSDGTGTSELGITDLSSQDVDVSATIIEATVYRLANPVIDTSQPVDFGNVHVGDAITAQTLSIINDVPDDGYSEALNATADGTTGGVTVAGSFDLLGPTQTDNSSITVAIDTSSAGNKGGTATIDFESDGTGSSGLGTTALASQNVQVSGSVYRYASASDYTPEPVTLGNVHVGDTSELALTISNTAVADTYSEKLNASIGSASGDATATGSFNLLAAGASDNNLVVGIDTSSAGSKSGTAQINLVSDGTGTSELGQTDLSSQIVNVSGNVYRLADVNPLNSVNFGSVHVGDSVEQALDITNTAMADGFSESLNASFAGVSDARILTSGSITQLAAGASDYSSMLIGLDTSAVGTITGIATVDFQSDGTGTSELGITDLSSQDVGVSGSIIEATVYRLANPVINNAQPLAFGNFREGDSVNAQSISITNDVPDDDYSEALNAAVNGSNGGVTVAGSFNLLGPTQTDNSSIKVAIDTSSAGDKSGTATIDFESDGIGSSGLGITHLDSQDVAVTAAVYRLAQGLAAPDPIIINARVGDLGEQTVTITNTALADGYSESLNASTGVTTGDVTAIGSVNLLAAQNTDNSSLVVGINTSTAGVKNGTATVDFESDGTGTSGFAAIDVGSQVVGVSGNVYAPAQASASATNVDFSIVHVGDVLSDMAVTVTNTALVTALNDVLCGSISTSSSPFNASGDLGSGLTAGASADLFVGLDTATAGIYTGSATISTVSHNEDMADWRLADISVDLMAQVNNYANPVFSLLSGYGSFSGSGFDYWLDLGTVLQGTGTLETNLALFNDVSGPADLLNGSFDLTGSDFLMTGFDLFSDMNAGEGLLDLLISLDTVTLGAYTGEITLNAIAHNASGFEQIFDPITVYISANVVDNTAAPIPEPATIILFAMGLMLMLKFNIHQGRKK